MVNGVGDSRAKRLSLFKALLGKRLGWTLWFIVNFVFEYGLECMNLNYVYPRETAKTRSDRRAASV